MQAAGGNQGVMAVELVPEQMLGGGEGDAPVVSGGAGEGVAMGVVDEDGVVCVWQISVGEGEANLNGPFVGVCGGAVLIGAQFDGGEGAGGGHWKRGGRGKRELIGVWQGREKKRVGRAEGRR